MIDLLIIKASENILIDKEKIINMRLESNLPNQETPNIGIAYMLANAKKHNLSFSYIDMEAYNISMYDSSFISLIEQALVIGFSAYTVNFYSALSVAKKIKEMFPKKIICFGGPHVTALPIETIKENNFIDFVICGEAEKVIIDVINDLKNGKTIEQLNGVVSKTNTNIIKHEILDLESLPYPAWEDFDLSKFPGYRPHKTKLELPINTSRGCPFRCVFCAHNFGKGKRRRSPESVIEEMQYMVETFGAESFVFTDDTFILNIKQSKKLFNLMIETGLSKKVKWSCEGRVDLIEDGLFELMKEAGCYEMFFGLESGDDEILRICKKNTTVEQIKKAVSSAKKAGLLTYGSFIIGLPGDTIETVMKSIKLGIELDMYSTTFPIATPLPGSELRDMAIRNEYGMRLLTNDWSLYGKQEAKTLESDNLSLNERKKLQEIAYKAIPKKSLEEYKARLKKI